MNISYISNRAFTRFKELYLGDSPTTPSIQRNTFQPIEEPSDIQRQLEMVERDIQTLHIEFQAFRRVMEQAISQNQAYDWEESDRLFNEAISLHREKVSLQTRLKGDKK